MQTVTITESSRGHKLQQPLKLALPEATNAAFHSIDYSKIPKTLDHSFDPTCPRQNCLGMLRCLSLHLQPAFQNFARKKQHLMILLEEVLRLWFSLHCQWNQPVSCSNQLKVAMH